MRAGAIWLWACFCALPALLLPIFNPDLFWHLSAGRWVLEHRAFARTDFLSFTAAGAPWRNFEWLGQVLFERAHALGGFSALWLLKLVLIAGLLALVNGCLRAAGSEERLRALAAGLAALGLAAHADLRPELFSLAACLLLVGGVELWRAGRVGWVPGAAAVAAVFAVWSNLHAGFFAGLALLGAYALEERLAGRGERARQLALGLIPALAGSLLNPYGWGPHRVAVEHWSARAMLSSGIKEWQPIGVEHVLHWPFWALLGLALAASVFSWIKLAPQNRPWALWLACAGCAAAALRASRFAAYFAVLAPILLAVLAQRQGWLERRWLLRAAPAAMLIAAGWVTAAMGAARWKLPFNDRFVPTGAAEYIARERDVLDGLRLYNEWEWGGYLAWRLRPWKVFADGRYIFHDLLPEIGAAAASAEAWQEFLGRRKLQGALVQNLNRTFPTERLYPDGSRRSFARPWYLFYFPRERWALIYWDEKSLLFVERSAVRQDWLESHEYRFLRPRDEAAFQDALARKEIPLRRLDEERARRRAEQRLKQFARF